MDDYEEYGNAFAIPEFGITTDESALTAHVAIADDDYQVWQLGKDPDLMRLDEPTLPKFELPDPSSLHLDQLSDGSLDVFETPGSSTASLSEVSIIELPTLLAQDIWSSPDHLSLEATPTKLRSWEAFSDKDYKPSLSPYLSEAGPGVFNAFLSPNPDNLTPLILKQDIVIASLAQLGLGRNSQLYTCDSRDHTFKARRVAERARPTGLSPAVFASIEADFITYGNSVVSLQRFTTKVYDSAKLVRAHVSLATIVRTILQGVEEALYPAFRSVQSLLGLQNLFRKPGIILKFLGDLVRKAGSAETDVHVLSLIYEFAKNLEHSALHSKLSFDILWKVSEPWLSAVSDWLYSRSALQACSPTVSFINKAENLEPGGPEQGYTVETEFNGSEVPSFFDNDEALRIFEIGQGVRLLQSQNTQHPLAKKVVNASVDQPPLALQSSWPDFHQIQERAKEYETDLLAAIRQYDTRHDGLSVPMMASSSEPSLRDAMDPSEISAEASILVLMAEIEHPLRNPSMNGIEGQFLDLPAVSYNANEGMEDTALSRPPLDLIPSLSFGPIIAAQARLVNQSCISLLFKEHDLRSHLSLHYRHSLLCDGVFASRLSNALFDPELPSAERRKGSPRFGVAGLKLGSREAWPPASSELRLALMGILSDSYYRAVSKGAIRSKSNELPGGLSFAIRAMPEDELQRCMNPDSIFALDFLRLQYKPPGPLYAVITQSSLDKYDTIFKLLLRTTRMLHCVKQLSLATSSRGGRGDHSDRTYLFAMEAHHFIGSVCCHFSEIINIHWRAFEHRLDRYETRAQQYEISEHEGLDNLRDLHEEALDGMMFGLLLRKRQEIVKSLLEEIFGLILDYARSNETGGGPTTDSTNLSEQQEDMYKRWRRKLKVFSGVCKGLSERQGSMGGRSREGPETANSVERLLVKLDMNGYYTQRAR